VSDEAAFVALVGDVLTHVTLAANEPSIRELGLLPPEDLARRCGTRPQDIALRDTPMILRWGDVTAQLNNQSPLLADKTQETRFLDGHRLESWAAHLDRRVFFWPPEKDDAFTSSLGKIGPCVRFRFGARALFRRCGGCCPRAWCRLWLRWSPAMFR